MEAREREDTEKIDHDVKKKAACLHHIAAVCAKFVTKYYFCGLCAATCAFIYHMQILKDKAQSNLKRAADQHWSDGALEVPF